jgi:hypothetical protein
MKTAGIFEASAVGTSYICLHGAISQKQSALKYAHDISAGEDRYREKETERSTLAHNIT